ncbi:MAG: hypothetical protein V3T41_05270 [bacterium]
MKIYVSVFSAMALAAAAFAAENVVSNGGFEAGVMAPWTTTRMTVAAAGARAGSYGAYYLTQTDGAGCPGDAELTRWCDLRQDLGRTVEPNEFVGATLWVHFAPDNLGNPWYLDVALGVNEMRLESAKGHLVRGWNRVTFPRELVTQPFGYIYVKPIFAIG